VIYRATLLLGHRVGVSILYVTLCRSGVFRGAVNLANVMLRMGTQIHYHTIDMEVPMSRYK
jgi:hypothetical protein